MRGTEKHGPVSESGSEMIRQNNNKAGRKKMGEVLVKETLGDNEIEQRGRITRKA